MLFKKADLNAGVMKGQRNAYRKITDIEKIAGDQALRGIFSSRIPSVVLSAIGEETKMYWPN